MKTYNLFEKQDKNILWGNIDCDFYYMDIQKYIRNNQNDDIELDLKGIVTIDSSFITNVFVKLVKTYIDFKHSLVFNNIENDSILYYLNKSFTENHIVAFIKKGDKFSSIGNKACCIE